MQYKDILIIAKNINNELTELGMAQTLQRPTTVPYDIAVTNKSLRKKTEKLFKDGHHA